MKVVETQPVSVAKRVAKAVEAPKKKSDIVETGLDEQASVRSIRNVKKTAIELAPQIAATKALLADPRFDENRHMDTYSHMFDKLYQIVCIQEERCLYSEKTTNIYALVQLYTQLRALIADIRAVSDFSQLSTDISQNVLRKLVSDVGQNMLDISFYIKKSAQSFLQAKEYDKFSTTVDNLTLEHGRFLKDAYQRSVNQVEKMFKSR